MVLTAIIILTLLITLVLVLVFKESTQRKWYTRGYESGAIKYDKDYYDRMYYESGDSHSKEAKIEFHEKYGFHYD